MKKFCRRFLSLVLVLCTVLTVMNPVVANAAVSKVSKASNYGVIVLGDSRTEYLNYFATKMPNEFFVYGYGMGYDWMVLVGIPQVNQIMASHPEYSRWKIVNYMGYNDPHRINEYVAMYQNMQSTTWVNCQVYYMSLAAANDSNLYNYNLRNGVAPEKMQNTWNADVVAFNQQIYAQFPFQYIDIYTPMLTSGYVPEDGIHYATAPANDYIMTLMRLAIGK